MTTTDEIDKVALIARINSTSPIIFDVGCYDGRDGREFIDLLPCSTVYAFEADHRSVELFNIHSKEYSNIKLIESALSNIDGEIDWFASDSETRRHYNTQSNWPASSSIRRPKKHLDIFKDVTFSDSKKVKSMKLDTWMVDHPDIDIIDIMWVDVNGGEREFILGAKETLRKVRFLYIEFNSVNGHDLYENCLSESGIYDMVPDFKSLGVYNFMGNFGNVLMENIKL